MCLHCFFLFLQIILHDRLQAEFVDKVSSRCAEVGMYCAQYDLISQNDYEDLRLPKYEGSDCGDRLLQLLRGTGNVGFGEFKNILARWKLPMGPAQLLKAIEEREKQLGKS